MAGLANEGTGGVFSADSQSGFKKQLNKVYGFYTGGFIAFVIVLAVLEQWAFHVTGLVTFSWQPLFCFMVVSV